MTVCSCCKGEKCRKTHLTVGVENDDGKVKSERKVSDELCETCLPLVVAEFAGSVARVAAKLARTAAA